MLRGRPRALVPLLLMSLLAAPTAQAAEDVQVDLQLPETFAMDEATLLVGHLSSQGPVQQDPRLIGARELILPEGTLVVCPQEGGRRDEVPPFPVIEQRCRNEEAFEDPQLRFGARTWLAFGGNHSLEEQANASMDLFVPDGRQQDRLLWARVVAGQSLAWGLDAGRMAFTPMIGSSEVEVIDGDEHRFYNGTEWLFFFEGEGPVGVQTRGLLAGLASGLEFELAPTGKSDLGQLLDPRTLLDLQDAALGPDAREPIENATELFAGQGRVTQLLDGALLGYLNGTVGDQALSPAEVSLAGLASFNGRIDGHRLQGPGEVVFTKQAGTVGVADSSPASLPWWLMAILFLSAGLGWALREPCEDPPGWVVSAMGLLPLASLLTWELGMQRVLGISFLEAAADGSGLGPSLVLLGFEVIAVSLAGGLIYLPLRVTLDRWLPRRWGRWARPTAAGLWLSYLLIFPGTVIAMGLLVARL